MVDIDIVSSNIRESKKYYLSVAPGVNGVIKHAYKKYLKLTSFVYKGGRYLFTSKKSHVEPSEILGTYLSGKVTGKIMSPVSSRVADAHVNISRTKHDWKRKNGIGGRTWLTKPGHYDMVVVFHDANRAGPHIDVHIGRLSLVYKVKPDLYAKLKYNKDGMLTEKSRKHILDHIKYEVSKNARVAQNIDHSKSNAVASWVNGDTDSKEYGSGATRQVVLKTKVDVYKCYHNGPIEMYAPDINPHRSLYIYKLYKGDKKRAPILIWGNKTTEPPKLYERLHLKMIHPENASNLVEKSDLKTSTAKYDGSSCYFAIGPKGTTVWSPRKSVLTNKQIEYTYKIDGIAHATNDETIVGMGELLFKKKSIIPFKKTKYLSASAGSGILNSNSVVPKGFDPEIRIYRIDKIGKTYVGDQSFWENRKLQKKTAKLHKKLKVVELMSIEDSLLQGYEGVVVVPENASVNNGYKLKWWSDPSDWVIDKIDFQEGDKGGIAGVAHMTSLESGKKFKLGPGQMGNHVLIKDMMDNPQKYEGAVVKVNSKKGHEGRASKVIGFHDDKGLAPC